jgi:hypothetical protein
MVSNSESEPQQFGESTHAPAKINGRGGSHMRSLSQIVSELEAQRDKVQRELNRLNTAIGALRGTKTMNGSRRILAGSPKPRRTMSASARKRIAAAQRARWAAWKAKQKKVA